MKIHFFFLAVVWGFLGGALFLFGPVSVDTGLFLFVSSLFLVLAVLWLPRKIWVYVGGVFLGAMSAWGVIYLHKLQWQGLPLQRSLEKTPVEVTAYPEEKGFYQQVILSQRKCSGNACQKILWQAPVTEGVQAGESFLFSCALEEIKNFSQDFDYKKYLEKEGIGFQCRNGVRGESLPQTVKGYGLGLLQTGRTFTERSLTRALPEPELGLAKGLILGGSHYLSKSLERDFQRVGMTHIVAVSGYNILLVAGLLLLLVVSMGLWRKTALWSAFGGVLIFIFFVGAPASAVRAGSMAGFSFLALASGRRSTGFMVLLVSAFLMLILNPLLLFYDIGFQLSFLALVGILFAMPDNATRGRGFAWKVVEAIKVTLCVEAFVLPIILYQFGMLSWFSLVANIVLIPLIPLAMFGALGLVLVGWWIPGFLIPLVSAPVYGVLWMIISFVEYFGEMSQIVLEHLFIPPSVLVIWYSLGIILGMLQLRHVKKKWYAEAFVVHDSDYSHRATFFDQ